MNAAGSRLIRLDKRAIRTVDYVDLELELATYTMRAYRRPTGGYTSISRFFRSSIDVTACVVEISQIIPTAGV